MSVPTVSATGLLAYIVDHAVTAVSASSTFQDLTGAADATEALDYIYRDYVSLEDENENTSTAPMPRAIVRLNEEAQLSLIDVGAWSSSGTIQVILESTIPEDYQQASNDSAADRKAKINAEAIWWLNTISGIVYDVATGVLTGGTLVPYNVTMIQGRVHPEENNGVPYRWAMIGFDWRSQRT